MELSRVNKPLVIRILGTVKAPQGVSAFEQGKSNLPYLVYPRLRKLYGSFEQEMG